MITTKQRAFLRSAANSIEPTVRIGKAGVTETVLTTVSNALDAHEIIKLTVLEACPESAKDVMQALCDALGCEPVQVIGRRVVVYRRAPKPENRRIVLPR